MKRKIDIFHDSRDMRSKDANGLIETSPLISSKKSVGWFLYDRDPLHERINDSLKPWGHEMEEFVS